MDLREALGGLSKASPYAVTTSGEITDPKLRAIKDYLYVETEVEKAFRAQLESIRDGDIIFLCGSSHDGKSEILTRYDQEYSQHVDFHLDATHSFQPEATAIDTLNQVFSNQKASNRPLVVGINIGMQANYEREGSDGHQSIKLAIAKFLSGASMFAKLLSRCHVLIPKLGFRFKNKLYSLDASTIGLFLKLFSWAKYRATNGAFMI